MIGLPNLFSQSGFAMIGVLIAGVVALITIFLFTTSIGNAREISVAHQRTF